MKTIYIAGPFRAATAWAVENNIRAAERWGLEVARLGAAPVIPHTMYRFFHGTLSDDFWLEAASTLLLLCDGMLVIEHLFSSTWRESKGTNAEVLKMLQLERPTFFLDDFEEGALATWITKGDTI